MSPESREWRKAITHVTAGGGEMEVAGGGSNTMRLLRFFQEMLERIGPESVYIPRISFCLSAENGWPDYRGLPRRCPEIDEPIFAPSNSGCGRARGHPLGIPRIRCSPIATRVQAGAGSSFPYAWTSTCWSSRRRWHGSTAYAIRRSSGSGSRKAYAAPSWRGPKILTPPQSSLVPETRGAVNSRRPDIGDLPELCAGTTGRLLEFRFSGAGESPPAATAPKMGPPAGPSSAWRPRPGRKCPPLRAGK